MVEPKYPVFPLMVFRKQGEKFIYLGQIKDIGELEFNFQDFDSDLEPDFCIIDSYRRKLKIKIDLSIITLEVTNEKLFIDIDTIQQIKNTEDKYSILRCLWKWFRGLIGK